MFCSSSIGTNDRINATALFDRHVPGTGTRVPVLLGIEADGNSLHRVYFPDVYEIVYILGKLYLRVRPINLVVATRVMLLLLLRRRLGRRFGLLPLEPGDFFALRPRSVAVPLRDHLALEPPLFLVQRRGLVHLEFEVDLAENHAHVRVSVLHPARPAPSHGLHPLQGGPARREALGHLELRRLQPVPDVRQVGGPLQDPLDEGRGPLVAELQLRQRVRQRQSRSQLAHQVQTPRAVSDALFGAHVHSHPRQPAADDVRLELGSFADGHVLAQVGCGTI
jgi:hypothetical protein